VTKVRAQAVLDGAFRPRAVDNPAVSDLKEWSRIDEELPMEAPGS